MRPFFVAVGQTEKLNACSAKGSDSGRPAGLSPETVLFWAVVLVDSRLPRSSLASRAAGALWRVINL